MKTEIIAIIDRSGSMASIVADAIGGFNTFLADQQTVDGEGRMTLVLFDDKFVLGYQAQPLDQAPQLDTRSFVPRGATALLDAIGRTINEQGARIEAEAWADKVVVCILTDGEENMSREYSPALVKQLVHEQEAKGWSFVFLAANQDAFATGMMYGFNAAHTMNFAATAGGTQAAYADMSNVTRSLRSEDVKP